MAKDENRHRIQELIEPMLVKPGSKVRLAKDFDPGYSAPGLIKDDAIVYDMHPIKRYAIDPVTLPRIYIPGFHRPVPGVDITLTWLST